MTATSHLLRELFPRAGVRFLAIVGFWTIVAILSSLHWWYLYSRPGPYTHYWQVLRVKLVVWYMWGALTPLLLIAADRFRITAKSWAAHGMLHLCVACVAASAFSILYALALLINLGWPLTLPSIGNMIGFVVSNHTTYYILAALATILLEHALRFMHDLHQQSATEAAMQKRLAEAEWDRLQAQLNPHFLFNLLNTCAAQVMTEPKEQAYATLVSVSDLLRENMHHAGRQLLPLREEVRFVERYLHLVQVRYAHRLTTDVQVDPTSHEILIPSHALFTLVENAVKHGAATGAGTHAINVKATRAADSVLIVVENTIGSSSLAETNSNGTGLKNLDARLKALYGKRAKLQIKQTSDGLNAASLTLPLVSPLGSDVTTH